MDAEDSGKTREQLLEDLCALRASAGAVRARCAVLLAATELIPDAVYAKDAQGRYTLVNTACAGVLGMPAEEAIGKDDTELFAADDAWEMMQIDRQIAADGITITLEQTLSCPKPMRMLVSTKGPFRDDRGRIVGVLGISRDITDLHAVIEGVSDAIYVKYVDGRNLMINSHGARGLGRTVAEVIGRDASVLFAPETAECIRAIDRRVMESEESTTLEELVTAAGVTRTLLTTKAPYRNANGEVIGVLGISRDISERKKAEEALRSTAERLQVLSRRVVEVQEQERRHIARELHDEIGQVLSAVGVNLQGLKATASAAASPRIEESIQIVDQAVEQVRNLSLELRPYMLDDLGLAASLRWLVDRQAQRSALVAHFAVESSSAPLPPSLATACFRIAQGALTNVVRHAHARNVWVELQQGEEQVRLLVRDDGVGFDLEAARLRARGGVAFGLLAIQERVALLGGRATVESQPGHGASVCVWFPLTATPPADEPHEEGQQ